MLRPLAGLASGRRGRRLLTGLAAALLVLGVLPLLLWRPGDKHQRESLEAEQHLEAPPSKAFCAKVGPTCLWYQALHVWGIRQWGTELRNMLKAALSDLIAHLVHHSKITASSCATSGTTSGTDPLTASLRPNPPRLRPCMLPLPMQTRPPLVCAHGGDSSDAPPNSADAFGAALQAGVDCVEIDVARTADNHLVRLV